MLICLIIILLISILLASVCIISAVYLSIQEQYNKQLAKKVINLIFKLSFNKNAREPIIINTTKYLNTLIINIAQNIVKYNYGYLRETKHLSDSQINTFKAYINLVIANKKKLVSDSGTKALLHDARAWKLTNLLNFYMFNDDQKPNKDQLLTINPYILKYHDKLINDDWLYQTYLDVNTKKEKSN